MTFGFVDMLPLLNRVLEAHGGLEQWRRFTKIEIDAVTGGGLFPLKGLQPDLAMRRMTVWLKEERASVHPFGGPDQRTFARALADAEAVMLDFVQPIPPCRRFIRKTRQAGQRAGTRTRRHAV
jgi:hypothetical protein